MKKTYLVTALVLVLASGAGITWWQRSEGETGSSGAAPVSYTRFLEQVRSGQVTRAVMTNRGGGATAVTATLRDGRAVRSTLPEDYRRELALLDDQKVDVEIAPRPASLMNAIPFLLLLVFWFFLYIKIDKASLINLRGT